MIGRHNGSRTRTKESRPDFQGSPSHPDGDLFQFINEVLAIQPQRSPSNYLANMPIQRCRFCGMDPPDHMGHDCPQRPSYQTCRYCRDPNPDHPGSRCPMKFTMGGHHCQRSLRCKCVAASAVHLPSCSQIR
eukprot:gnl/TRDRNA2_/TRDRNA2_153159_c0_seq1.p1 gnl/TRDRNA2_/TRDRNA2_153159_c0~~gnl/TRDRNA2_/TRDRNA2_153159_c0_seq1.p1  ORF type:complete len:132 (+),score=0.78 gnl/TRDRNA2_/TRDRNA2_153159_c0_seq1:3-398(+)